MTRNCTDGNDENPAISNAYTDRGLIDFTTDQAGRKTTLIYDAMGRVLTQTVNANGAATPVNVVTSYTYDGLDRSLTATQSASGTVAHSWDTAGRPTGLTFSGGPGSVAPAIGHTSPADLAVADPGERVIFWLLPPRLRELNPAEHLWQWLRDQHTRSGLFRDRGH